MCYSQEQRIREDVSKDAELLFSKHVSYLDSFTKNNS